MNGRASNHFNGIKTNHPYTIKNYLSCKDSYLPSSIHSHGCRLSHSTCNTVNDYTMSTNHPYNIHIKYRVIMPCFHRVTIPTCIFNDWTCNNVKDYTMARATIGRYCFSLFNIEEQLIPLQLLLYYFLYHIIINI